MDWQRKRHPEDVPTPVAVAVADFCRRAKSPASPGLVRDALALLDEHDDAKVRALADSEPKKKLGPFAFVDVILGTDEALAAERQAEGYYEKVRRSAEHKGSPEAPMQVLTQAPVRNEPLIKASVPRAKRDRGQSLRERVAPKKRVAGEAAPTRPQLPRAPAASSFLPKRSLPAPRGRFTTVDPSRASLESLFRPDGKATMVTLMEQVPHRIALLRTLEQGYVGRKGTTLSVGDVEDLLEVHGLFDVIEKKEMEGALASLIDEKGSMSRAGQAFGMTGDEFRDLVTALGIKKQVDEVREKFTRQALDPSNLSFRLELLFRTRYLEDLRIEKRFETALTEQLQELIDEVEDAATSIPTLVDLLSRQHALHAETLRRALDKLGLLAPWQHDEE